MNNSANKTEGVMVKVVNYSYLITVIVGILGNILAFVVFSRKKFQNTIFSTYFRALLVVDTIGLLYLTIEKFLWFEYHINLRDFNVILCRITMPFAYSIPAISAYITVMISFDRWLTIAKPTVLLIRKKRKFQIIVCITIIITTFLYNGQLFFSYIVPTKDNWQDCTIINENLLSTMDLINTTILPFTLMLLFTLLTINAVFVSRRRIRNNILNNRVATANNQILSSVDFSRKRDIRFVITSILLNIIFLVLNAPHTTFYFVMRNINNKFFLSTFDIRCILFLLYLNHASVFFINAAVNTQFKEELSKLYLEKKLFFSK
jgi:hypothetical protein